MRPTAPLIFSLTAAVALSTLTGCGGGSGNDKDTLEVAFPKDTNNKVTWRDDYIDDIAAKFEKANPGKDVKPVPIQATGNDYYTKIQQMMRSSKTAPDLVYEDTFLINSDIKSGYLLPLDGYLKDWKDWDQFEESAKKAARAEDGKTYGVPDGTDTRGLWFNKKLFKKAGLPQDWQPRTWDEVLETARTLKRKLPDVIPLNVFTGKGAGEAAAMQGFEMLLYGTDDPLYDEGSRKWVTGSKGFRDSLEFVETVYSEKLGPDVSDALDANIQTRVPTEYLPEGKLAIALDGSWLSQQWIKTGGKPWPEWSTTMGRAAMPTQDGGGAGKVSMSGGWTWSIPKQSDNHDLAWKMIKTFQTQQNATDFCVRGAQIAVRADVAEDPQYQGSMPGIEFFTDLVEVSEYRPALPVYPQVSAALTEAMEQVTAGDASPGEAADRYDEELESLTDGAVTTR
ncbi:ABC transporter substrate-binding protein [Streptomyces sp. N2-109]|uniref:ABC transporter substrate-binding protein n=1 Tax=Streptomyces gossypii TaxID=2883101 RepID=A0ABT2JX52_9ACTN|nr:ABC transporter substrate-binding protein [Streptomyces gossypii]MCT2592485.1 ABC transporter substrate-binding protein [Streptomyces gossypii]